MAADDATRNLVRVIAEELASHAQVLSPPEYGEEKGDRLDWLIARSEAALIQHDAARSVLDEYGLEAVAIYRIIGDLVTQALSYLAANPEFWKIFDEEIGDASASARQKAMVSAGVPKWIMRHHDHPVASRAKALSGTEDLGSDEVDPRPDIDRLLERIVHPIRRG